LYEKSFSLEIIARDRLVFQGEVTSVSAPGVQGGFQVLYNHAPLLSALQIGIVRVKNPAGLDTEYATAGGYLEVRNNRVVVLVECAERADEIDLNRARASRDRALERLRSRDADLDILRAELALARAINRLRAAGGD
jgi:F-type H+-transporting ATPase subunit epsilon